VRVSTARFTDVRLWAGAALLVTAAVVGGVLASSGQETVVVWRASADLAVGSAPRAVVAVEVPRAVADEVYARPGDSLEGVLRWPVAAGELLPRAALQDPASEPTRRVTVPVDPMHAPTALQSGDLVDVWSVPRAEGGTAPGVPSLVLPDARVAVVSADASGFGGEVAVALDVPVADVPAVVAAGRSGLLDLVAVPVTSQDADL
jgi:hypothetical protein